GRGGVVGGGGWVVGVRGGGGVVVAVERGAGRADAGLAGLVAVARIAVVARRAVRRGHAGAHAGVAGVVHRAGVAVVAGRGVVRVEAAVLRIAGVVGAGVAVVAVGVRRAREEDHEVDGHLALGNAPAVEVLDR